MSFWWDFRRDFLVPIQSKVANLCGAGVNGVRGMALIKMGGEGRESEFLYNGILLLELPPSRFLRSVFCDGIEERTAVEGAALLRLDG